MSDKIHQFTCSCENATPLPFADFKKHLADIHGLSTPDQLKGKKNMVCHMDGDKWYSSTYKWTLDGGLTFTEYYEAPRSKEDMMYH